MNQRICSFLKAQEPEMFKLLENLVRIQSGSHNKPGVDRVARLVESVFQENSVSCQVIAQKERGNHLVVRSAGHTAEGKQVLLVGHMDTVFPKDTDFNWYKEDDTHSYGPGVIDMKGGLVAGIFALKALDDAGLLNRIPVTFIFNSDEEIGSLSSKELIKTEARNSAFAFVLECGGLNGEIVTGRKGNITLRLDIEGRAGHAASAGKDKASAILELARQIIAFEALNDHESGITVNVGQINGGIGPNTVPAKAGARIDFRFSDPADENRLYGEIENIVARTTVPGTRATHEILSHRGPMPASPANTRLFAAVREVAKGIGVSVIPEFRFGVSDANFIAAENIPVIDGLGPIGARDHSEDEYMVKKSLLERTTLIALSIVHCREIFQGLAPIF